MNDIEPGSNSLANLQPNPPNLQPNPQPEPSVTIWETIAIVAGAAFLVAIGLAGLGVKAINNAFEPERAEAIARSIITYDLPESQGRFGTNLGGARMAVIASRNLPTELSPPSTEDASFPAAIELLIARTPISQESEEIPSDSEISHEFFSGFSFLYPVEGAFEITNSRIEYREFCGGVAPVVVQIGMLTIPEQSPVRAVRYGVLADRDPDRFLTVSAAVGLAAPDNALNLFRSIRCTSTPAQPLPVL